MRPLIHRKPLSPSATTNPYKKANSSQHERHLREKLSSRNISSSLKLKGPQHSQDGECDASSTSISQCDARDIGNFDQRHRKGQKRSIISQGGKLSRRSFRYLAKRLPQSFPQWQIKNREQLYVTMESKKNKLETDENKLDNHHDDPDCMVNKNKNWYKVVWREWKKLVKRIVNSEADADSSSDQSTSFDTRVTKRHSDSRNKLDKHFLPKENLAFPSSDVVEVKIESWDRVTFHKITPSVQACMILEPNMVYNNPPTPAVSSHVSISDQRNIQPVEVKKKFLKMSKSTQPENIVISAMVCLAYMQIRIMKGGTEQNIVISAMVCLAHMQIRIMKGGTEQDSVTHSKLLYVFTTLPEKTGEKSIENRSNEEKEDTIGDEEENEEVEEEEVADNFQENEENLVTSNQLDMFTTKDPIQVENRNNEEKEDTIGDEEEDEEVEEEEVADNFQENEENLATSKQLVLENAAAEESYLDSTNLQQMPKQMQPTVDSSVKSKTKERKRLSSEGNTFIMVDPEESERALEEKILEDVLDRLWRGDEFFAHRLVDARLERAQASERGDNRLIHSDCRLVSYISTENGSYWHQFDKRRANIISERDTEAVAAKDEKMKVGNQSNVTSAVQYSAYMQKLTTRAVTELIENVSFEGTAYRNQTKELMLHKYLAERQKAQIKANSLFPIFRYTEMEIIGKTNYTEELTEKIRESEAFIEEFSYLEQYTKQVKNRYNEEKADSLGDEKQNLDEEKEEGRESTRLMPEQMLSMLSDDWINVLSEEVRRKFINRSKSIHPEDSLAQYKLLADITTSSDKTGEEPIEKQMNMFGNSGGDMPGFAFGSTSDLRNQFQPDTKTLIINNASAGERSKHESTGIRQYRNVIRNETCRMMTSIDNVVTAAKHLFGHERTQIFFDLLDDELFHFEPAGAVPGFIPNMTESIVRQYVISFFEHSCDTMNRLMTSLLGCPDRERLQQMSEQNFKSLMRPIIDSSLKTKIKGEKRLSSKGSTFVMVGSEEFERALGEEIPGAVLDRFRRGDEMVAHRFVDTRLERTQASEGRENRPIHSIYFPSDCRLFIYIPTKHGSYWHQADMQRANRIRQNDKYCQTQLSQLHGRCKKIIDITGSRDIQVHENR